MERKKDQRPQPESQWSTLCTWWRQLILPIDTTLSVSPGKSSNKELSRSGFPVEISGGDYVDYVESWKDCPLIDGSFSSLGLKGIRVQKRAKPLHNVRMKPRHPKSQ